MSWLDDFNRGNWLGQMLSGATGNTGQLPDIPANDQDMLGWLSYAMGQFLYNPEGLVQAFARQPIAGPQQGLPPTAQQAGAAPTIGVQVGQLPGQAGATGAGPTALRDLLSRYGFPDVDVAVGVVMAESGGNPNAQGRNTDGSLDRGIWQINNRWHPEVSDQCAYDPICATQAAFAISNGGTNFGPWTTFTTGAYRAHTGANPMIQGGAQAAGQAQGASDRIPIPFSSDYFARESEYFHQTPGEMGNDYETPVGTEIVAPFGGTISTEDHGHSDWGKRVFVHMPNGWTMAVGHMHSFYVQDGQVVAPGSVLGQSGGAKDDPSSGVSTGPHIEFQLINPQGQYVDPHPYLQQIFDGANFSTFMGGQFLGANQVTASQEPVRYMTPDGMWILENTPEDRWYKMADSVWTSVYGMHAPSWAADTIRDAGVQNTDQLHNFMMGLPSHIPGLNLGAYENLQKLSQASASKYLGIAAIPDSLIKDFAAKGLTSSNLIDLWFESHSSSDIPKDEYAQIWQQANTWTQALSGTYPHPNDVAAIWQRSGGTVTPRPTGSANPLIPTTAAGSFPIPGSSDIGPGASWDPQNPYGH